ncbi:uncharacterized protein LOC132718565 isoform X1 [Ruditapes philippinarum]|uniref:uncharacterized protein LOC132718565 isoform X1 n=1 Tax=Ruditapes philippinarum TaxID=129788 RepID=UPI00295A984F|nr:uncharacterized protein LOC132718565 isoform X1 [Ruditapes philippinarum]
MVDSILFTFILFAGFTSTFALKSFRFFSFWFFFFGGLVFIVITVVVSFTVCCLYRRRRRGHIGHVCRQTPPQRTTIDIRSPPPYEQVGYNGTINRPVTIMTSNVIPGTTQQWQKPVAPLPPNFKTTRRERLVIK